MYTKNLKRLGMIAAISIIVMTFAAQASAANDPEIVVCAPDWAITAFDAIIKMEYFDDCIKDLEGEFDLSFDTDVVSVVSVTGMKIKTEVVSIEEWEFVEGSDNKKIHVEFIIPADTGDRTYGEFVKIQFNLEGDTGDSSLLDISSGSLAYKDGTPVSAKWTDDTVNIGDFDVTVYAPESVSTDTFDANIEITDVVDLDSAQLELSFDLGVVRMTAVEPGKISGTTIPVDSWGFKGDKNNTIIVNLNLPGTRGVSGSGTLATISFDVTGEDGDSSVLDIDEDSILINTESDELPINWIDATVTIDSAAPPPPNETDTYVYVKNLDDDKLTVFLFIDGDFITDKDVSSGSTKKYSNYKLLEGLHIFRIRWYDLDTEEWHEKIKEYSVSGETDLVAINTDEHADEDTNILARVYVKNLDDDALNVYLYIDDKYKKYETVEFDDTCEYEDDGYEFDEEGVHSFKIKWRDPDTEEEYEKIIREYIKSEEAIMLYVDRHTEEDITSVSKLVSTSSTSRSNPTPTISSISDTASPLPTTTSNAISPTDPVQNNSNGMGNRIATTYTLIGIIAIVFAVVQLRRI